MTARQGKAEAFPALGARSLGPGLEGAHARTSGPPNRLLTPPVYVGMTSRSPSQSLTSSTKNRITPTNRMRLLVCPFNKYWLSSYCVPGASLGAWRFSCEPHEAS